MQGGARRRPANRLKRNVRSVPLNIPLPIVRRPVPMLPKKIHRSLSDGAMRCHATNDPSL